MNREVKTEAFSAMKVDREREKASMPGGVGEHSIEFAGGHRLYWLSPTARATSFGCYSLPVRSLAAAAYLGQF